MIETKHFRLLRAIHETGSVSGAARTLGYSQPAITQQLQAIERQLQTVLIVRSKAGTRLTEAGEILLRHGDTVLNSTALAESEIAAVAGLRSGHVRLTSFPSAASTIVPGTISRMSVAHPGVSFSMIEAEAKDALAYLSRGECDIAIIARYSTDTEMDFGDFTSSQLIDEEMHVVLHEGHPLADRETVALEDLANEKWIAGCPKCRGHLLEACRLSGFVPDITFETDDYVALQSLAARGVGVALLPQIALSAVVVENLVLRATTPRFTRTVSAVYSPDMARVPAIRETLRAMEEAAHEVVRHAAARPAAARPATARPTELVSSASVS